MGSSEREDDFKKSLYGLPDRMRMPLLNLLNGQTYETAARIGGISRVTLWRWCRDNEEFARLVLEARKLGSKRREYILWRDHPFRGCRPPRKPGAPAGSSPRFRWRAWPG